MGPEDPFDVSEALVHFLRAASKGVAHLTIQDETRADLLKLRIATVVIPKLVRRYVYEPLNLLALLDRRHHPCPVAEALGALNVTAAGIEIFAALPIPH